MEPLSAGYLSRKALPIKRGDAEPLTREDVQYDMLQAIFADTNAVFTSQAPGKGDEKVTFCDLYLHALYSSSKCSKVLKDKMTEDAAFALELSKISLLVNIGRINTTMAFFPEMKTALRTYHPIPSLQKSDGNAQDAPRIKNCLKAALLPSEFKYHHPTPEEILARSKANIRPPTSIVNLIFVLANHAAPLANVHFDGQINFLDLFLLKNLASADRARVFLWLIFRYLEGPHEENPFDDEYSRSCGNGKAPRMRTLSEEEQGQENQDTAEEIKWGERKSIERNEFLHRLVNSLENEKKQKPVAPTFVSVPTYKTTNGQNQPPERDEGFLFYVPPQDSHPPPPLPAGPVLVLKPTTRASTFSPQLLSKSSMLKQAFISIRKHDPLADSDDENDEEMRVQYSKRLDIISRLRGRPPTPESQLTSHVQDGQTAGASSSKRWRTGALS
ncbi:hypothetical protein DL96DRAFT_1702345 [Flagelloscypha sp. PMI_526]|nr:hypothetical protein DL96DRAFT_1702345 [Flagelloscypha sp. PMI_526]